MLTNFPVLILYMESYNSIVNPDTGRKVNINSKKGKEILKKYSQMGGVYSSYSCKGFEKEECNSQPNNRCKWSEAGQYCRKAQSSSKARGKKNWSMLKSKQSSKSVASAFSNMGKQAEERRAEEERQRVIQEMIEGKRAEIAMLTKQLKAEEKNAECILKKLVQSENKIEDLEMQIQKVHIEIEKISN